MHDLNDAINDRITHVANLIAATQGFDPKREQENWDAAQQIVSEELQEKLAQLRSQDCFSDSPLDQVIKENVRNRSYEIAASRGFGPGQALDDWLSALQQVEGEIEGMIDRALNAHQSSSSSQQSSSRQSAHS